MVSDPLKQKQEVRERLADEIKQYLKNGGKIHKVPFGVAAKEESMLLDYARRAKNRFAK